MGLEDADLVDYGDAPGGGKAASSIPCSICLEDVTDFGDRAWAKLHCGHQFHLDCIGSAFNVKGAMQCPNCRKIEKGQWLYADGGRPYPELNIDDLVNDDDLYDLTYPDSSMWCPYGSYAQLAAAFDEVEFPATAYHDIVGQHGGVSEHATTTATHMCPYIAYVQPLHPSNVTQGPRFDNNNINNNSNNNNQWNSQSAASIQYHTTLLPTPDVHLPSMPRRPPRTNAGPYAHPLFPTQSSSTRPASASMNRGYPRAGAGERSQPYFQQPIQRSNGQLQVGGGAVAPSDQSRGGGVYYVSASSSSSGRNFQESDNSMLSLFHHIWERDPPHQHPVERVPFHQAGGGGGGFRQRHGSERMPSQSRYWL